MGDPSLAALVGVPHRHVTSTRAVGGAVCGDRAPDDVRSRSEPMRLSKADGKTSFSPYLPNPDTSQLDLKQEGDPLFAGAGSYHRVVMLPDSLRDPDVASAAYFGRRLTTEFT